MKKLYVTILILAASFSMNAQNWWGSKKIRGNGEVTTETRNIGNFESVSVGGNFDVILINGEEGKLTIKGEENILPYIETEVRGNTLKIRVKENVSIKTSKRLLVTVPFNEIDGVSLAGSGNVNVEKTIKSNKVSFSVGGSGNIIAKVNATKVTCSIGGSGDIKLQGNTETLKCSIAGSGTIKGYKLKSNTVSASIAGSGDVYTTVSGKIKASVVGSGSIYYKGKPKYIDTNAIGSGDVIDKN